MAPKSSHIAQKFAPNLAGMMRYAIDASIAVRGWEYTDAAMSRDMSDITVGAGVRGRITATSITRWLKGATAFEPRSVLKIALYLQAITNEVAEGSDRDKQLISAYDNFAKSGPKAPKDRHRIWGDTPQTALTAGYDWLLYGPGVAPPPGVGPGRHDVLEWPNAATILGGDMPVPGGLTMGAILNTVDALDDAEQLQTLGNAVLDRLAELAQAVDDAAPEVEPEPELPCDPANPLLLMLRKPMGLSIPLTEADIAKVCAATKIEPSRVRALLCGWDIPNHNEGELLNGAAGLVEGMVNIYMAAAPNLNNLNAPSTTHV
jgi:hypothetical protein